MSLLLYGITDSGPALPDTGQGVGGASVRRIGSGGLVAIATEHGRSPAFDEEALWAFEQVVESHMTDGAILPIRFGTLLPDAAATERMLRERRTEFSDKLERIRGAVELSVRGIWPAIPDATIAGAETGTGYMRSRAEPRRRAREIAARVHARLDGHARDHTTGCSPTRILRLLRPSSWTGKQNRTFSARSRGSTPSWRKPTWSAPDLGRPTALSGARSMTDKLLSGSPPPLSHGQLDRIQSALNRRVDADPEGLEKGLAQLVLTVIELLRQLMERQAVHRMEAGNLSPDEVERLGRTFMALAERMEELKEVFGLEDEDLNLNLGPLGDLM